MGQRIGGVQRFSREVVKALDTLLAIPGTASAVHRWTLVVPNGALIDIDLKHIEIRHGGVLKGHAWDQFSLFWLARSGIAINLANTGPVLHPRNIVVIHDAAVYRTPGNFTSLYGLSHRTLGRLLALRSTIGTVSMFSRAELAEVLRLKSEGIFVIPNGSEHVAELGQDVTIMSRLNLVKDRFFLFVGSPSPNKNLHLAIRAFGNINRQSFKFVIAGSTAFEVFRPGLDSGQSNGTDSNVIAAGRLSDGQISTLLRNATALVFPSAYEGFGIPPLEGMINHCPVLASNIPPVREVCGDAVLYFDPVDADSICHAMQNIIDDPSLAASLIERGKARVKRFSWEKSASALLEEVTRRYTLPSKY